MVLLSYSCDTLMIGLALQSALADWWCLHWIPKSADPSIYNGLSALLRPVPPEMERPLGAGRLGLSHWAGPSVTGSAGWSQSWYRGIIVDILAKESKFP